jgi:hypothetical protein
MIQIPIEIGDVILRGKFRNKKVVVKSIGVDEYGAPTVNGKSILSIRLTKKEDNGISLSEISRKIINKNKV